MLKGMADAANPLPRLIARLEKARAGSDGLDRAIATALKRRWSADEDGQFGGYDLLPQRCWYTRSVDAALTLVPKGCSYLMRSGDERGYWTYVRQGEHAYAWETNDDGDDGCGAFAPTQELSLAIAALKARV